MTLPVSQSPIHPVYADMPTTVFEAMSGLARELGAINLGQGFPDDFGPPELIEAAVRALREKTSQYPPARGLDELRDAICDFYRRRQGLELTREQVVVTSGATEAIADAVLALVSPGDEVILFQPAYDAYAPMVRRAGGVPVSVALRPPEWRYLAEDLAAAITPKTRVLMLNDPLNPAGTAASEAELAIDCCGLRRARPDRDQRRGLGGCPLRRRSPPLADDFSRHGGTHGQDRLGGQDLRAHRLESRLDGRRARIGRGPGARASVPHLHHAPGAAMGGGAKGWRCRIDWFAARTASWAASRERLRAGLEGAGFRVLPNAATWFLCVDLAASGIALADREFSERAVREAGVASIPVSALFEGDAPTHIVRFCFTKPDAMLDEAVKRLGAFRHRIT